jgi:hypothetical protein
VEAIALNGTDTLIVAVGNDLAFYKQTGHHPLVRRLTTSHRPVSMQLLDNNRLVSVSATRVSMLTFNFSAGTNAFEEIDFVTDLALNGSRMTGGLFCAAQSCYLPAIDMRTDSKTGSMHGVLHLDLDTGHVSSLVSGPEFYYPIGIGMLDNNMLVVANHWGNNLVGILLPTLEVLVITESDHFNSPSQLAVGE